MRQLIFGEGPTYKKEKNKTVIDIVPEWCDIVHDLNNGLPKLKGKFDYIEAHHILEHIESSRVIVQIIRDCYKLLNEGGELSIKVPHWHSESAVECIEHCHFFNENSFMNFYDNPYAKEMNMPQFKVLYKAIEDIGGHKQVSIKLTK